MGAIRRFTFGRSDLDPLVSNYIAANGETNATVIGYLNTFAKGLRADGLISKIQAFWFFYDNALKSKYNFMNPSLYTGTFFSSGFFNVYGWQTNGLNSYMATGFIPNSNQTLNSNGLGITSGSNNVPGDDRYDIGALNSGAQASVISLKNSGFSGNHLITLNSTALVSANTDARGIFVATKQSATVTRFFKNNTSIALNSSGGTLSTVEVFIGCLNLNGAPYGFSNQRIQNAFMIEGLSDSDVALLNNRIDILENALGRKTW